MFVCVCSVIELCPTLCNPMNCSQPGNGTPLQHSCLENPTDGGAWWAAVYAVMKSRTRLSDFTFTFHFSLSCIGEGNGNPLQCSCLENPRDGGAWWVAVYGVTQSWTQLKRLGSSSSSSMALLQPSLSWHFSWQHSQNLLSAQTIRVFYVQLMDSCCLLTSHFPRATFSEPPGWGGPLA